jgi:hypothetical protein
MMAEIAADPQKGKRGPGFVGQPMASSTEKTRASAEGGGKKDRFYEALQKEFRRDGFTYRQIAREGRAAIYEQTWNGYSDPSVCYEVVRIRRREGFQIDGRFVEPAEVYPNSGSWGVDGFTLTDKDAAFAKQRELRAKAQVLASHAHLNLVEDSGR